MKSWAGLQPRDPTSAARNGAWRRAVQGGSADTERAANGTAGGFTAGRPASPGPDRPVFRKRPSDDSLRIVSASTHLGHCGQCHLPPTDVLNQVDGGVRKTRRRNAILAARERAVQDSVLSNEEPLGSPGQLRRAIAALDTWVPA